MNESTGVRQVLDIVSEALLWGFGLGIATMLLWFGLFVFAGDLVYSVHGKLFQVSREQFDNLNYFGLMLTKLVVFTLFLFPYVGIRLALRNR